MDFLTLRKRMDPFQSSLLKDSLQAGWPDAEMQTLLGGPRGSPTQAGSGEPGPLGSALAEGCVGQDQETQGRGRVTGTQLECEELSCLDYSSGALCSSIGVWVCVPAWAMMTLAPGSLFSVGSLPHGLRPLLPPKAERGA